MGTTTIDESKLEAFMGQAVTDMGAVISAPLFLIGEKLGLYKAMAHAGPLTSQEIAERAGVAERSAREWLRNQAAGGYVTYDADGDRYTLPDEHALALADEDSPFYILGAYELIASLFSDEDAIREAFRTGGGMGWHEHDHRLFRGTERFFRGSTTTLSPSPVPARRRRRRASPTGPRSRSPRPRITRTPVRATTWCACSTACTTWATRSGPRRTCAGRSRRRGRG